MKIKFKNYLISLFEYANFIRIWIINFLVVIFCIFIFGLIAGFSMFLVGYLIILFLDFLNFPYLKIYIEKFFYFLSNNEDYYKLLFFVVPGICLLIYYGKFDEIIQDQLRPPDSWKYKNWEQREKEKKLALEKKEKIQKLKNDILRLKLAKEVQKVGKKK